jgi:Zn-dependent M28 family amino/carboxypeptidase
MMLRYAPALMLVAVIIVQIPCAVSADNAEHAMIRSRIEQVAGSVNSRNLRDDVVYLEKLGNRTTWENQWTAARWAVARLKASGIDAMIWTYTDSDRRQWPTVVGKLRGANNPEEAVLAIAHLDSISDAPDRRAPGANDNGSGVASILEIARVFAANQFDRTLLFCLSTNEETNRGGSKFLAAEFKRHGVHLRAVINLDVLGYNRSKAVGVGGIINSHHFLKNKGRAAFRLTVNWWKSLFADGDRLRIEGRTEDRPLIAEVAGIVRQYTDFKVQEKSGGACG